MYKTYEFIYAGIPSSMYGLYICDFAGNRNDDVAFGNSAKIIEKKVNNRVSPLHYGVDYNSTPLSFKMIFASKKELNRWDMQEIAHWLTGRNNYEWLSIEQSDMKNVQYKCIITDLKPISVGWAPYAFEANVRCDCPYAYGNAFSERFSISKTSPVILFNDGTARVPCKPDLKIIKPAGVTEVNLINESDDNREFSIVYLPSTSMEIYVSNENGIIIDKTLGTDLYSGFNDVFFRLIPGINQIKTTGNLDVTFEGRFYFNIGA